MCQLLRSQQSDYQESVPVACDWQVLGLSELGKVIYLFQSDQCLSSDENLQKR